MSGGSRISLIGDDDDNSPDPPSLRSTKSVRNRTGGGTNGNDEWEAAIQNFLNARRRHDWFLLCGRLFIAVIAVIVAVAIGVFFPRKIQCSYQPTYLSIVGQNKTTNTYSFSIDINTTVYNPNIFPVILRYDDVIVFYGPLVLSNQMLIEENSTLQIPGSSECGFKSIINVKINETEILDSITDPQYKTLARIFLNYLVTETFSNYHVSFTINSNVIMQLYGYQLPQTFSQTIVWDNTTNTTGYSGIKHTSDYRDVILNDHPVDLSLFNMPIWFYLDFGLLIFVFILIVILMGCYVLCNVIHAKKVKEANLLKLKSHQRIIRPRASVGSNYHISFTNLGLTIGNKTILEGVSGSFASGRLTAIMGASGCGKTSMLSVLSGRIKSGKTTGTVYINGQRSKISKFKKVVGFVPQEDIMSNELTVEELMQHSSRTRSSASDTNEESDALVEEVLELLNLESIRDVVIGDSKSVVDRENVLVLQWN